MRDIGSRRKWHNCAGVEADFLTADEIDNLTIRASTLTMKERDLINHHIDPDLFDLFVRQGVYRRYAEQFLDAGQIDAVDEANRTG